jgi:small subunit ribosomal protein S1
MSEEKTNQNEETKEVKKQETPEVKKAEETKVEAAEEKKEEPKAEAETKEATTNQEEVKEEKAEASEKKEEDVKAETSEEKEEEVKEEKAETSEEKVEEVVEEPKEEVEKSAETKESPIKPMEEEKEVSEEEILAHEEPQEFDWDNADKSIDDYSKSERESYAQVYDNTLKEINEHQVVKGTVVRFNDREIVVNIGFKSDAIISRNELNYVEDLKPGHEIDVYIENQEDKSGQLILSHKKARTLKSWERINQAEENQDILTGKIISRTKGGLIADVLGIEAFLPGSQIDIKPIRDFDQFVGKTMEFKVVKINAEFKNVVVSHKALIQDELEKQKAEIMANLEKGQVLEGIVKNITSYGVFIDLGGVDGLVHITDLSWGRINHPEEVVTLDEKIKVVILDYDESKKRIALGLKQLTPHPWDSLNKDLKVGDKVKGKVVVLADYGAFIEIQPGIEGLIHVSEMSWSQHLRTAQDFLNIGDEVEGVILTIDHEDRKMSLGMKQLIPDPWANIQEKYPKDSKHKATVRNFTNFGIFVELEEGVDGLIHISDLSWSKKIKHPAEFTQIGEEIDVTVLDVDIENRRLSLGHKQLKENPWDVFETVFEVDSVHEGTIASINNKGAVVTLPYGVEGFAPSRHLKKEDGEMPKKDETLEFKVIEFSKNNKKIIISHSRIHEDEARAEKQKELAQKRADASKTRKEIDKVNKSSDKSTLGDFSVLEDLKQELKESEKAKAEEFLKKAEEKEEATQKASDESEKAEEKEVENKAEEVSEPEKEDETKKAEEETSKTEAKKDEEEEDKKEE